MIWVPTHRLEGKIISSNRMRGIVGGDWDLRQRVLLADTDKHKSIYQHFVDGVPWEETDVFTNSYMHRFKPHESQQGKIEYQAMLMRYRGKLEDVFRNLKRVGFSPNFKLPFALVGRSGEVMLGNQGNHRVAMAKLLGIERVPCEVIVRHSDWERLRKNNPDHRDVVDHPDRIIRS
jgi:hypothetical protein